jgi:uncharacterized protein
MLNKILMFIKRKIARFRGRTYVRTGRCNRCGFCCTMVTLFIDNHLVRTDEEFEYLVEIFPEYRRFSSRGYDDDGHLLFTCCYLGEDFRCGDYRNRPIICRDYPNQNIMQKGGKLVSKCGYTFTPVENFGNLLDEVMHSGECEEEVEENAEG